MPVSVPAATGQLSATSTFAGDAHNGAHGRTVGMFRSVKGYGARGDGATDDTTAIQTCINESVAGDAVLFGSGCYMISAPLVVPPYVTLQGSIWAANNEAPTLGSQIKMIAGGSVATWGRKAMVTHGYYNGTSTSQGPIQVRDLYLNGNSQSVGSGVVVMGSCNVIENCLISGFNGTTDWTSTAGTAGSGYGVVWTSMRYAGTQQGNVSVNSWFRSLRIGSNNNSIFIQKTGTGGPITDWVMEDIVCLRPPDYTHAKDDIRVEAAGGALIRHVHTNGSAGSGIHVLDSGMLRITECYLDGWGQGNGAGVYGAIQIDGYASFDGGAGSGTTIDNVNANHRTTATAAAYVVLDVNMTNSAELAISNVTSHIQATSGSHYFADITGTEGIATMTNCVANTNGTVGLPYTDARIFRSDLTGVTLRCVNNSWQHGTAAPTTGQWGLGMQRLDSTPGSGTPMGWTCSAAGLPGTWLAMPNFA